MGGEWGRERGYSLAVCRGEQSSNGVPFCCFFGREATKCGEALSLGWGRSRGCGFSLALRRGEQSSNHVAYCSSFSREAKQFRQARRHGKAVSAIGRQHQHHAPSSAVGNGEGQRGCRTMHRQARPRMFDQVWYVTVWYVVVRCFAKGFQYFHAHRILFRYLVFQVSDEVG